VVETPNEPPNFGDLEFEGISNSGTLDVSELQGDDGIAAATALPDEATPATPPPRAAAPDADAAEPTRGSPPAPPAAAAEPELDTLGEDEASELEGVVLEDDGITADADDDLGTAPITDFDELPPPVAVPAAPPPQPPSPPPAQSSQTAD